MNKTRLFTHWQSKCWVKPMFSRIRNTETNLCVRTLQSVCILEILRNFKQPHYDFREDSLLILDGGRFCSHLLLRKIHFSFCAGNAQDWAFTFLLSPDFVCSTPRFTLQSPVVWNTKWGKSLNNVSSGSSSPSPSLAVVYIINSCHRLRLHRLLLQRLLHQLQRPHHRHHLHLPHYATSCQFKTKHSGNGGRVTSFLQLFLSSSTFFFTVEELQSFRIDLALVSVAPLSASRGKKYVITFDRNLADVCH